MTLVFAGCLSKPALRRQTFAFQNPPATSTPPKGKGTLALRACEISPLFADRSLAYRTGQDAYELDPYAGFLVRPEQALAIPLQGHLRNSGVFADVVKAGDPSVPDALIDVHVSELYGDFRDPAKPMAVLSLEVRLFRAENGKPGTMLLQKGYSRSIALDQKTAAALVAGWDKELGEIMNAVAADLAGAKL